MNDFDITAIETLVTDEVRKLSVSSNVWNNRPKSTSDTINDFVVVKVSGGVTDRCAFGECVISIRLFARDVKEMKNKKRLSVMQKAAEGLPIWIEPLLIKGNPTIVGDTPDDFGFHARIMNFKAYIKSK